VSSKSINRVFLLGHLGKDPEVRYTPSGVPLAKFSLATNERYKDKSGDWQEKAEWHQLVAWQRNAEIIGEYGRKGCRVHVEGRLQTSSWDDKHSGEKKYRTEIVVKEITLLDGGRERNGATNGNHPPTHNGHSRAPQRRDSYDQREPGEDYEQFGPPTGALTDEEIPF
jgi:single-strand DNA-binding protein